jgi:hypothetical protein
MAGDLGLSKFEVLEVLKKVDRLEKYSLRWVPHSLCGDQKAAIVEVIVEMLSLMAPLTAHARSWALTGDESWFDFSYDYEGKRALARDSPMTKPQALINTIKMIILVIWSRDGPALVEIVPPNLHVSAKDLCKFAIPYLKATVNAHRRK